MLTRFRTSARTLLRTAKNAKVSPQQLVGGGLSTVGAWSTAKFFSAEAKQAQSSSSKVKVALCQILCGDDKLKNIDTARTAVQDAVKAGANLVVLPEVWNSPYDTKCFPVYAEPIPDSAKDLDPKNHPTTAFLIQTAKENGIYLIGGSYPEKDQSGKVYNTCVIVNPDGEIIGKHRKVHLFDIDVPGKITFKESDTLTAGNTSTTFETPYGTIGVAICYDIRFPELSMIMRREGAKLLVYPGAFNMTTGPPLTLTP